MHVPRKKFASFFLAATVVAILMAGCGRIQSTGSVGTSATQGELKTFSIRGKVISVDTAKGSVLLDHEAVPGFMEAMTMSYKLKNASLAGELHPGDRITAKLLVRKSGDEFLDPMLDEIVVIAQARPDYKPAMEYHVPSIGDQVPDFKLINQDGRTIHLGQFKGKVLLMTFIYTRCPLADYCPRMNKNFAAIDKQLAPDDKLYKQTHLLSVSFDPRYDTPAILKSYGGIYTGGNARTFMHWDFATTPIGELPAVEQFFDLGVTPGDSGTLNHSLSTALIGKDGKVLAWYPTNDWTTTEILAAMRSAASA